MATLEFDEQPRCESCHRPFQSLTPISLEFPQNSPNVEYHRPHVDLEKVLEDINGAVKSSFPSRTTRYDAVYVLLLRWEEDDLGTAAEIQKLQEVFQNSYHFMTESWQIPSVASYIRLNQKVLDFQMDKSENDLLILYYGGHGINVPHHNDSVWAA